MSKTSLKIKRNIDIHSKRTVFIGNETGEYAKSQTNKLPKVDMSRVWQAGSYSFHRYTKRNGIGSYKNIYSTSSNGKYTGCSRQQ